MDSEFFWVCRPNFLLIRLWYLWNSTSLQECSNFMRKWKQTQNVRFSFFLSFFLHQRQAMNKYLYVPLNTKISFNLSLYVLNATLQLFHSLQIKNRDCELDRWFSLVRFDPWHHRREEKGWKRNVWIKKQVKHLQRKKHHKWNKSTCYVIDSYKCTLSIISITHLPFDLIWLLPSELPYI